MKDRKEAKRKESEIYIERGREREGERRWVMVGQTGSTIKAQWKS